MVDCTQEVMLRCMHVLSITGCRSNGYWETDLNTNTSQVPKSLCRTNNYWETGLNGKNLRKSLDSEIYVTKKSSRQTIWARFMMITSKMWPLERQQGFPLIWFGDLVSGIKWPSFKLDLEIIQTNILSNIYDDYLKNVTSGVSTRFSFDLAWWPSFCPKWPSFKLDLEIIKKNILGRIHDDCFKNVTARVLKRSSFDLAWRPSFLLQVTQFQTWPRNHQDKHIEQDSRLLEKCDR